MCTPNSSLIAFKFFEIKNRVSRISVDHCSSRNTFHRKNGLKDNFRLNRKSGKNPGTTNSEFRNELFKSRTHSSGLRIFFPERSFCQLARNLNPDKSGVSDRNEQICFGTENNLCSIMHSLWTRETGGTFPSTTTTTTPISTSTMTTTPTTTIMTTAVFSTVCCRTLRVGKPV